MFRKNLETTSTHYKKPVKKLEQDKKKLNSFQEDQLLQIKWWLENIHENMNEIIENLQFNCAIDNRKKQSQQLKNQINMLKIIIQVKQKKTLLQGFNYRKSLKTKN